MKKRLELQVLDQVVFCCLLWGRKLYFEGLSAVLKTGDLDRVCRKRMDMSTLNDEGRALRCVCMCVCAAFSIRLHSSDKSTCNIQILLCYFLPSSICTLVSQSLVPRSKLNKNDYLHSECYDYQVLIYKH